MTAPETTFTAQNLEKNLSTALVGKTVLVYQEVDSTNDLLKPILHDSHYNGLAVFARHQRRGKGREGRTWTAPPGTSILTSVLVHLPGRLTELAGPVALASAVAAGQAVARTFQLPVKIKWPNDLYLSGKKLAGILIESAQVDADRAGFIIGIGINVAQTRQHFPPDLQDSACSVAIGLNREVDDSEMVLLARELMAQLDDLLQRVVASDFARLRHDWLTLAGGPDHPVIVNRQDQVFHARIIDIDHRDNSLLVQDPRGLILQLHQNTCKIIG